ARSGAGNRAKIGDRHAVGVRRRPAQSAALSSLDRFLISRDANRGLRRTGCYRDRLAVASYLAASNGLSNVGSVLIGGEHLGASLLDLLPVDLDLLRVLRSPGDPHFLSLLNPVARNLQLYLWLCASCGAGQQRSDKNQ